MNNITDRELLFALYGALYKQKTHPLMRLIAHHLKIPEDKYITTNKKVQNDHFVSNKGKLSDLPPPFNDVDIDKLVNETFKRDLGI